MGDPVGKKKMEEKKKKTYQIEQVMRGVLSLSEKAHPFL